VIRECSALDDLLRFSRYLNADSAHAIRRGVVGYAQHVEQSEWEALAHGRQDQPTEKAFTGLLNAVMRTAPANTAEELLQQKLFDISRKIAEYRDERVNKSLTRIPPTLLYLVQTLAGALLLLVFVYPFHHWVTGALCFILVALVLFVGNLVLVDTDNPFSGVCNISAHPYSELQV
jgi:hypothetical protein